MGFNGDIVALRGPKALTDLTPFVGTQAHPVAREWQCIDDWHVVQVQHIGEPSSYDREMLEELYDATDAPVLVCDIFESDVAYMQGLSSAGYWDGWLDPASAAVYRAGRMLDSLAEERGERIFDESGRFVNPELYRNLVRGCAEELAADRPRTAQAIVDWAADAGFAVELSSVAEHLGRSRKPFAEQLAFQLLALIGIEPEDDETEDASAAAQ